MTHTTDNSGIINEVGTGVCVLGGGGAVGTTLPDVLREAWVSLTK